MIRNLTNTTDIIYCIYFIINIISFFFVFSMSRWRTRGEGGGGGGGLCLRNASLIVGRGAFLPGAMCVCACGGDAAPLLAVLDIFRFELLGVWCVVRVRARREARGVCVVYSSRQRERCTIMVRCTYRCAGMCTSMVHRTCTTRRARLHRTSTMYIVHNSTRTMYSYDVLVRCTLCTLQCKVELLHH